MSFPIALDGQNTPTVCVALREWPRKKNLP